MCDTQADRDTPPALPLEEDGTKVDRQPTWNTTSGGWMDVRRRKRRAEDDAYHCTDRWRRLDPTRLGPNEDTVMRTVGKREERDGSWARGGSRERQ